MYTVPLAVDVYSRTMIDLFDERNVIGVSTGFQSLFGNPANASKTIFSPDSSVVDIDIMRGNEKTAALVLRGQLSTANEKTINTQQEEITMRVLTLMVVAAMLVAGMAQAAPTFGEDAAFLKKRILVLTLQCQDLFLPSLPALTPLLGSLHAPIYRQ